MGLFVDVFLKKLSDRNMYYAVTIVPLLTSHTFNCICQSGKLLKKIALYKPILLLIFYYGVGIEKKLTVSECVYLLHDA